MKIVTVEFDYPGHGEYRRMFEVFRASCAAIMPAVSFEEHLVEPPRFLSVIGQSTSMKSNVHKLRVWNEVTQAAKETVVFCDCDMLALASIEDVDEMDFDLAYTVRDARIPINGGIVFVKPTPGGRAAMAKWNECDELLFKDLRLHAKYRQKYAGMNQAAFGYMLENFPGVAKMIPLPCPVYNSCLESWGRPGEKIVHVKSMLRWGLLANRPLAAFPANMRKAAEKWKEYDKSKDYTPMPEKGRQMFSRNRIVDRMSRGPAYVPDPIPPKVTNVYTLLRRKKAKR